MSSQPPSINRVETSLSFIISAIDAVPFSDKLSEPLKNLRLAIQSLRPARVLLIGRSGAGKSALINAIFGCRKTRIGDNKPTTGAAVLYTYSDGSEEDLCFIDTRGIAESRKPEQATDAKTPEASLMNLIGRECPDIILFISAAEAARDDTLKKDLMTCEELYNGIVKKYKVEPPILGVLTKCDKVEPSRCNKLPTSNERKNNNLEVFKDSFGTLINQKFSSFLGPCILVCSDVEFEEGDHGLPISDEHDLRWNIDLLLERIRACTPKSRLLTPSDLNNFQNTRVALANTIVTTCTAVTGSIAAVMLIPGSSLPVIGTIQAFMVIYIGWLSGRSFSVDTLQEFLKESAEFTGVGVGMDLGAVLFTDLILKFAPGAGQVASAGTVGSATATLGKLAIDYFLGSEAL